MRNDEGKKEKDHIRSAFRVLNLQAVVVLLAVLVLPYVLSYGLISELIDDVFFIGSGYASTIHAQYLADPGPEQARRLAAEHRSLIAYEGPEARWYTDGERIVTVEPGMDRPYLYGIRRTFTLDSGGRLIITWPTGFFVPVLHAPLFLSWVAMPLVFLLLLYFLLRRALYPLRWMQSGIQELTRGNLDFTAPTTGRDSRNALARKFNSMTSSIRSLIRSKDQLVMDLSHELRSPITRMKVALELLPPDQNRELLEKNVANLEDIITTILEAQRINLQNLEHRRESCKLAALARECAELTRGRAPGIAFTHVEESLVVSGDRGLLKLLVHNLLDNALKYSPEDAAPVAISLKREKGRAVLEVRDHGPGIPEEALLKVFEPFFKVAPERGFNKGYGLGLSLCKRIAELHGGAISLRNAAGGGLIARVELPTQENAAQDA